MPLFTAVLAHYLTLDERLTPRRLAGVLIGMAGVALMVGPDALGGLGADVLAQLAILVAGVSYAFAGIFGRRFAGTPPLVTATGQVTAAVLGYVVYFRILATAGATNLLLVTLLMPAIALVLGTAALGERLAPRHFTGMAFIAAGLAVIDGRLLGVRAQAPGPYPPQRRDAP